MNVEVRAADWQDPLTPPAGRGRRIRFRGTLAFALPALAVFGLLAMFMLRQQRTALAALAFEPALTADARPRPLAEVRAGIRALKLVTTAIHTAATKTERSENWRGTAAATVTAPVTLLYGVDLDQLGEREIAPDFLPNTLRVRLPRPTRIATQVDMEARTEEVTVTGLRFRTRSGEYLLGLARAGVQRAAEELVLAPDEQQKLAAAALERVHGMIQRFVGPEVKLDVAYRDE